MTKKENENYTTDKPITSKKEDAFQRYGFSKRIAETIISRKSKESIVFGIFGIWGEGKTSVINFIKNEISSAGDEFVQITFNPWRFTDEAALLTSFFNTLATEIKKIVPEESSNNTNSDNWFQKKKKEWEKKKEPLKTNTEAIGELIQKYGKLAAIFGAGEAAESIGKAISDIDIETLKSRIESLLKEHKKRIIIYLDDIDRLDKIEIHSIFRLVKLTGDFSFTSYILSFDEEMVAAAIGDRFGSGDKKAGESFLEKIIQVPLNIPKAQPEALQKFCFQLVDNAINFNEIDLKNEEVNRFAYQFTNNILSRLTTPRLAVRYGNTLSFTIPLLRGEANMIDLMLIEAIRIFYPNFYSFVKNNPDYFIGSYSDQNKGGKKSEKIDNLKEHLKRLSGDLEENEIEKIESLLLNLFPGLRTALGSMYFNNQESNDLYLQKRIASTSYFDRYFTYAVIEGDISDVEFTLLLELIRSDESVEFITKKFSEIIKKTNIDKFLYKLRAGEKEYDWSSSKVISKALSNLDEFLPVKRGFLGMGTPLSNVTMIIYQLLQNHKSEPDLFDFSKEMITYPRQFEFAYELNNWMNHKEDEENLLFNNDQYQELSKVLVKRAIEEAGEDTLFEKFPEKHSLFDSWAEIDKSGYNKYTKKYLDKDKNNIKTLIKLFISTIYSASSKEPFKGDLIKKGYDSLISYHDKEEVYNRVVSAVPIETLNREKPYWKERGENNYTDINMLRQFLYLYNQDKSEDSSINDSNIK